MLQTFCVSVYFCGCAVYVVYSLQQMYLDFVSILQDMGLTDTGEYVVIGVKDDETYDYDKAVDYMFVGKMLESIAVEKHRLSRPKISKEQYNKWLLMS